MSGRMRAQVLDGVTKVKVFINHPMETGARKDKATGETVPRHFIQEISCEHNGRTVLSGVTGWGLSRDPYLAFGFQGGAAGDRITLRWVDNLGQSETLETTIR